MNLISISLWGTNELYLQGAICNARLAPVIYPGWAMRVYCRSDVPVIDLLRSLAVDVRIVAAAPADAGYFWRFLPAAESDLEHVIIRDADSRLNVREKAAVDAWIASGRPFHVMRDHFYHRNAPMLGGMWGCRGGAVSDMRDRIARFDRGASKHDDTKFLRAEIWPLVRDRCLVHSSVPDPLGGDPFPPHSPFDGFVGEIVDLRAEARDIVAVLLPSRGRPGAALAAARSARLTAAQPDRLRILVGIEPDEAGDYRAAFGDEASWIHVLQSGGSYVRAIRELHRSTTAGIYGLCADDFVFETAGWDREIRRAATALPEGLGLVYADDGLQGDRIATAPFLTQEWIDCVGDILPGSYEHMFCDTELTAIALLAGLIRFLPDVKITHRHHLAGEAAFDSTYERSAATMAAGRAEFERRQDERQRLADRLAQASRAPVLSILIPSLVQRADLLGELLAEIQRQREALPDSSVVEVLVEPDAGERSAAAKRKSLLGKARGRWVAFIEDDDVPAADAVGVILRVLEQDPDGITCGRSGGVGSQTSKRAVVLRRSVAVAVSRRDVSGRDDFQWSETMSKLLQKEVTIREGVVGQPSASAAASVDRSPDGARRVFHDSARHHSPRGLPSAAQQLLLTAALGRDEIALRAWKEWVIEIGPERADPASTRLFPLVWTNLQRLGAAGIEVNSLKPSYWRSWAASLEHSRLAGELAGVLQRAGLPTLLLKGVALAARHYEQPALRPMNDVDLMVPAACAAEAMRLLTAAGWRPIANFPPSALRLLHGLGFEDRAGRLLDLHWRALIESARPSADDGFWARAESVEIGGTSTRILAPADALLHVCVHGLRWAEVPAIQWVADVMAILSSAGDRIDWDLLVEEAQARHVVLHMRRALDYVRVAFEVAALDRVCRQLSLLRCSVSDRIDFQLRVRPPSLGRAIVWFWFDHRQLQGDASWLSHRLGFPGYLRSMWGLRSLTEIPATAARKGAHMLTGRARA